jgi:hypothetical protein
MTRFTLQGGSHVVLPKDRDGRSILLSGCTRDLTSGMNDSLSLLRCLFYVLSTLAEEELHQRNGIIDLLAVVMPHRFVEMTKEEYDIQA